MPWVARAVLDELLASQRALREMVASGGVAQPREPRAGAASERAEPSAGTRVDARTGPGASAPDPLTPEVLDAVTRYAFGDPKAAAANLAVAMDLHRKALPPREIVARLRQGDRLPELLA